MRKKEIGDRIHPPLLFVALFLGLIVFWTSGNSGVAYAASDPLLFVQPSTVKPGDAITVQGLRMSPKSTVDIRFLGSNVNVSLGKVQTDGEGSFTALVSVPTELKGGTYRIQASDVTGRSAFMEVSVQVGITGASGTPSMIIPPRERPVSQIIGLLLFFVVLAGLGLLFARTAHGRKKRPA